MKYLAQTYSYIKKNFWLPLAVMIVPSVIACFLSTPYWEVAFVSGFNYDPKVSIGTTFGIMFGDSWKYLWPVVLIAAFQTVGAALVMSAADQHLRTGKLSLRTPLQLVNNAIFPTMVGVIVMSVLSIVWRFALFGLVILIQAIGSAAGFYPEVTLTLISVLAIVLFVLHVIIITPMLYWAPIMFIYGYRFRDAAATSFKLLSGKKVFRSLLVPLIICAAIQMVMGFLSPHIALTRVVSFFVMLVTNMLVPVFVMVSFYKISDLDRRDLMPYENISLPMQSRHVPRQGGDPAEKDAKGEKGDGDVV